MSLFVCVVLRKKGRILEVDFDGDAVVLVASDLWLLKICRQSVKLHQDEAILPPLIQVTGWQLNSFGSVCIDATSVLTANVPCLALSVSLLNH